jgi:hypothetical protein
MSVVTAVPFDQMSLPQLREEAAFWNRAVVNAISAGALFDLTKRKRDEIAAWLKRREREAGLIAFFACDDCGVSIELLAPVHLPAHGLACLDCGGAMAPSEA